MRTDLKNIPIYQPPGADLINLANNENFYSQWTQLLKPSFEQLSDNLPLHQYGNSKHELLVARYANYIKLQSTQILPAPGSDSLIPLLINALTTKRLLTLEQDFFRYRQVAAILNRENIQIPLNEGYIDNIIHTANEKNVELIILSSPNNPLGIVHARENLIKLLDNTNCYIVIDEAYGEYQNATITDLINQYDKLIVLKTLSKAWGLACLRVGFALTNTKLLSYLKAIQGPFVLSDLNANLAASALEHYEIIQKNVEKTNQEKAAFIDFLKQFPIDKIYESFANFVYITADNVQQIQQTVLADGIAIAYFAPNGLRITIGTPEQMTLLKTSLSNYFKKGK